MTREEQIAVCAAFNLGDPIDCKPLGGTRNRNYHLTTTSGEYVARDRYIGYCDQARIAFDHEALEFLGVIAAVAKPYRTIDRQYVLKRDGHVWEVFPFMPGTQFREGDREQVRGLAKGLAQFHLRGREFSDPHRAQKLGPRGEADPKELMSLVAQLRLDAPREVARYERWIAKAAIDLSDSAYSALPHTLIHGDVQPANVLMILNSVSCFIDLDWCDWRPRIYDLAFAILLCCATHETPIDGGDIWSLSQAPIVKSDLVRTFFQTYNDQGWPLMPEERAALRPQVFLSWCHVRLAGAMKVDPSRRAQFLARPPHDLAAIFPDGICE
jgi:Ser/Thr protein kinase RdoA (MazF antagonist)